MLISYGGKSYGRWQYSLQKLRQAWGRGEYTVMVTRQVTWFHKKTRSFAEE
jgi:hypothetical protein